MLRKTILAGAATLAVGAAALAPTSAFAWWGGHPGWHPGYHGWHHGGFYRPAFRVYAGPVYGGGCFARRVVWTPYGPAGRWVNVCHWG
jgi:hypothetical protein